MLKSTPQPNKGTHRTGRSNHSKGNSSQPKKIASMGKISVSIINELYNPIDAINRFINLALQSLEEGSQSRQFLIESKKGVRKTSLLLKRLSNYVKRIEKESSRLEMEVANE